MRGFGTAIMHGGTTALFAMMGLAMLEQNQRAKLVAFLPGVVLAVALHLAFNHMFLSPRLSDADCPRGAAPYGDPRSKFIVERLNVAAVVARHEVARFAVVVIVIGTMLRANHVRQRRFHPNPLLNIVEVALNLLEPANKIDQQTALEIHDPIELRRRAGASPKPFAEGVRRRKSSGDRWKHLSEVRASCELIALEMIKRNQPIPGIADERELEIAVPCGSTEDAAQLDRRNVV